MDMSFFLTVILPAIIVVILGIIVERVLTALISRSGKKKGMPTSHIQLTKLILRWILFIVVVIVVVGIFGINVTNLWVAITGVIAMALVGFFAVWSILGNILATLVILIWHPFKVGDKIAILPEAISGEASEINLLFTRMRTEEGDIITVPNLTFVTKFIKVLSKT